MLIPSIHSDFVQTKNGSHAWGYHCKNIHESEAEAKRGLHFALAAWKPLKMIGLNRISAPTAPNCRKGPVACRKRWQKLMDRVRVNTHAVKF